MDTGNESIWAFVAPMLAIISVSFALCFTTFYVTMILRLTLYF